MIMNQIKQIVVIVAFFWIYCHGEESDPNLASLPNILPVNREENDDYSNEFQDQNYYNPLNEFQNVFAVKRKPPRGFFGMRGKKDFNEMDDELDIRTSDNHFLNPANSDFLYPAYNDVKRSVMRYLQSRGKKLPYHSTFFGMRGKKYPLSFRGRFVGVRGKKFDENFDIVKTDDESDS